MIIAKITQIKQLIPIALGSEGDLKNRFNDEGYMMFSAKKNKIAQKDEKGRAIVEVEILYETKDKNAIESVFLVEESPDEIKLLNIRQIEGNKYEFDLYFGIAFRCGFEEAMKRTLFDNTFLVAISPNERQTFQEVSKQKVFLNALIDIVLPERKEQIKALIKPAFALKMVKNGNAKTSHFVGKPKLPKGMAMPKNKAGKPLFHIATIQLKEVQSLLSQHLKTKMLSYLSFFIDLENTEKGWPETADRFRVFHYEEKENAIETPKEAYFENEYQMLFKEEIAFPMSDHSFFYEAKFSEEEDYKYCSIIGAFKFIVIDNIAYCGVENYFLGYPISVQHCVAYEAERIYEQRSYSNEVYKDALEWQLLLQISPDVHWFKFFDKFGDGTLYFMIRKQDLEQGNFQNVQLVVQGT